MERVTTSCELPTRTHGITPLLEPVFTVVTTI